MWKKIKLILRSLRQYKKDAIITPFFMIGEAALECALPFTMSVFISVMRKLTSLEQIMEPIHYTNGPFEFDISLFAAGMILVGMALLSLACGILGGVFASRASVGLAAISINSPLLV